MYDEKKRKEREEQEALVSPTVRSSAGSVDQAEPFRKFPVDSIMGPTRCKLYVPVAKGSCNIEVASGMVYPGRVWHCNPVPPAYVRVSADMIHENAKDCKLDFPTPDSEIDTLGDAKNELILWPRRDITLEGHVPPQIQHTLEPVHELHDPKSPEHQLAFAPPSPVRQPAHQPARTAPEQPTSGSAPSIGSHPPACKI